MNTRGHLCTSEYQVVVRDRLPKVQYESSWQQAISYSYVCVDNSLLLSWKDVWHPG